MTAPLVTITNLNVTLGGHSILAGLSCEIPRGRITALIGLNGSGKTTLLRALLKEIPYTGRIQFHCGHDHRQHQPRHVGYVPQKLRLEASIPFTVRDLLGLTLQRRPLFLGLSRRVRAQMEAMLAQVGAPLTLLDRPVEKISGGELQRVLLALALEPSPELLLLDEPAAGIDFKDQGSFYELIHRLNESKGITILLVSHDISMVSKRAHNVLCLKDGVIHCQGPIDMLGPHALQSIFGPDTQLFAHQH
jgi:zinc transport system ATP-binding protein